MRTLINYRTEPKVTLPLHVEGSRLYDNEGLQVATVDGHLTTLEEDHTIAEIFADAVNSYLA